MNINLNLYKYFYEVAKYGSFTKAAEKNMISQPSLSYSIKVLEEQLNQKLFIRKAKKLELTPQGKEIYDKLVNVFEILESITNDEEISGNIIIGTRTLYAVYRLPYYLNALSTLFPKIKIDFKIRSIEELEKGIKNNNFDIIIDEIGYDSNNLISKPVKDNGSKTGFIIATKYKALFPNIITEDYFKANKIALAIVNKYSKDLINEYPFIKYDNISVTPVLIEYLKNNAVLGFSNLTIISNEINSKDLTILPTTLKLPITEMKITYSKNNLSRSIKAVVNVFTNYLIDELNSINDYN